MGMGVKSEQWAWYRPFLDEISHISNYPINALHKIMTSVCCSLNEIGLQPRFIPIQQYFQFRWILQLIIDKSSINIME